MKLPPCFPLCNGNSLLHGKRSSKKLQLHLLWVVWQQERGMEVSALLLKAQRLCAWQGAGDSRGPRRPGTLAASAASQAGRRRGGGERDGCLRKNCKKEKQEIQPSVQNCPLPPKPPGAMRWPQEVSPREGDALEHLAGAREGVFRREVPVMVKATLQVSLFGFISGWILHLSCLPS